MQYGLWNIPVWTDPCSNDKLDIRHPRKKENPPHHRGRPPKNALIALFSAEVRLTCSKILESSRRVQIIMYHFNLRSQLSR